MKEAQCSGRQGDDSFKKCTLVRMKSRSRQDAPTPCLTDIKVRFCVQTPIEMFLNPIFAFH